MKPAHYHLLLVTLTYVFLGSYLLDYSKLRTVVFAQSSEQVETTTTTTTTITTQTSPASSSAQTTEEGNANFTASPTPYPVDTVFTKPRQTEEIKRLKILYQEQVEKYRELERTFYIDNAQFKQLNTLQSLEKAVVSTRQVMLARTDVLITYFELVRASVEDTEGIELSKKNQVITESIANIEALRSHREAVEKTVDRDGANARSDEFDLLRAEFEATAHLAIALITAGDIQSIYDKSRLIYDDILILHQEHKVSALRQAERDRAYTQVNRLFENVGIKLLSVRTNIEKQNTVTRHNYSSAFGKDLEAAYSGTAQLLSYLKELIVELTE